MNAVIIYDVSTRDQEVKRDMIASGYYDAWNNPTNSTRFKLPHNTLWRPNTDLVIAKTDLERVINNLNQSLPLITLTRCIVLSPTPWDGIQGI
jgi:hypothetical protein